MGDDVYIASLGCHLGKKVNFGHNRTPGGVVCIQAFTPIGDAFIAHEIPSKRAV